MMISNLNISGRDFKIKSTDLYLCNERNTKFIYKNLTASEVIGIAGILNGKIIEVIDKKLVNKKKYYKVKHGTRGIGWISLENSIRVYRIPTYLGKYTPVKEAKHDSIGLVYDENDFTGKIVEAKYYFKNDEVSGLLINNLGSNAKFMPIELNLFHKFIAPPKDTLINIKSGTNLYLNNKFESIIDQLKEDKSVTVTGYYEKLDEVRININNKKYWIKENFSHENKSTDSNLDNLELINQIVYLKNTNVMLNNRLKQEEKIKKFMKQNIAIDNDLQKLFLKRYLGDFDEVK